MIQKFIFQSLFNLLLAASFSFIYFNLSIYQFQSKTSTEEEQIPIKIEGYFNENKHISAISNFNLWKEEVLYKGFKSSSIHSKLNFQSLYFSKIGTSFGLVFSSFIFKILLSFFTVVYLIQNPKSKLYLLLKLLFPIPLLLWMCVIILCFLFINFNGFEIFYISVKPLHLQHFLLPISILVLASWPSLTLLFYSKINDENLHFLKGLKAKGLAMHHRAKHYLSLIHPIIIAYFIHIFPTFLAGSFLIEKTFNLPGVSHFIVSSFLMNDIFITSFFVFFSTFLVLTCYFFIQHLSKITIELSNEQ